MMILRRLRQSPGFTLTAVLSLALGIGATTAVFSIVQGALLQPLPYPAASRLVSIHESIPQFARRYPEVPVDTGSYAAWQGHTRTLEALGLLEPGTFDLTGYGQPSQVLAMAVSSSLFGVLGARPRLGRGFTADDDQPQHNHVIVLSDAFWRSQFHADPGVVGRSVDLNGQPNQIVGVLPASFHFPFGDELGPFLGDNMPHAPDLFRPLGLNLAQDPFDSWNYGVFGRLRPGATAAQAQAELTVLTAAAIHAAKAPIPRLDVHVTSLRDQIVGQHTLGLWLLMAAVGAVLLIVCLNLANLLLVRVHGRGHELAIRTALGAGRARMAREVLAEGLALAAVGGLVGVAAAEWAVRALVALAPAGIPRLDQVRVNVPVLGFALLASLLSGLAFTLGPALRAGRNDPQAALRAGGRGASDTAARLRLRQCLVAGQAALSALLLVAAGLLASSYWHLLSADTGFQAQRVLTAETEWNAASRPQAAAFDQAALANLRALPGVQAAGLINYLPLQGSGNTQVLGTVHDPRPFVQRPVAERRDVSPGYLEAMGIPLLSGRGFTDADMAQAAGALAQKTPPAVAAIVSAGAAAKLWPGRDPLGQECVVGGNTLLRIIGVAGDVRADSLAQTAELTVYIPFTYYSPRSAAFTLRTAGSDPAALAGAVRAAIWRAQPAVTIPTVETMGAVIASSTASRRFQLWLVLGFAGCALLLAALGIYGIVSYTVERRTGEICVRAAMGASPRQLFRWVVRQGLAPVAAGVAAGLAAALLAGRLLASLLFGVRAYDPATFALVAALLLATALAACLLPARRATRVAPSLALRQ